MKSSGRQTKSSEICITNRLTYMEERTLCLEDKVEEIDSSNLGTKCPESLGCYEKAKVMNDRKRGQRRNPDKRHRKYF